MNLEPCYILVNYCNILFKYGNSKTISSKYSDFGGFFSQNPFYEFVGSLFFTHVWIFAKKERLVFSLTITLINLLYVVLDVKTLLF